MAAQAPPPQSDAQTGPRRRGRTTVVRRTMLGSAAALAMLLLLPQLSWMHPSCGPASTAQPRRQRAAAGGGGGGDGEQGASFQLPPGFRYNKVVAIIAFDRFEYFRQVVDGLRQAWGSEEYVLTITIDGPPEGEAAQGAAAGGAAPTSGGASTQQQQQQQQAGEAPAGGGYNQQGREAILAYSQHLQWLARNGRGRFRDVVINASATNLGVWPNKKRAVAGALALSDFAVILEDDIVLERDALRWFEWHVTSGLIFRRPEVAVATCWSSSFPYHPTAVEGHDLLVVREMGLLDKYWIDSWAQPWGWATWRRTWDALGANWTGQDLKLARAIQAQGWVETMPLVARCNNIGSVGAHKKGQRVGHIHQRALTSASFGNLRACRYGELPRANTSAPLDKEPLYLQVARRGILGDTKWSGKGMEEHRQALQRFKAAHPEPSGWRSSC